MPKNGYCRPPSELSGASQTRVALEKPHIFGYLEPLATFKYWIGDFKNYRRYFSSSGKQKGPKKVPFSHQKNDFFLSKPHGVNSQNEELVELVQNMGHMP